GDRPGPGRAPGRPASLAAPVAYRGPRPVPPPRRGSPALADGRGRAYRPRPRRPPPSALDRRPRRPAALERGRPGRGARRPAVAGGQLRPRDPRRAGLRQGQLMAGKLRVGIIGTGFGTTVQIPVFRGHPRVEVVAV